MGSPAYRNPIININSNVGNVTDSYKNVWNNCEISMSDEKRQILEWLSPLAPKERHQAVREGRVDGVGDWFLRTNEFEKWHKSEDQAVNPVLFCYGDPGVGKTYLSSLVIDRLCDAIGGGNVAVACVYCDFHAHKTQSATGVLAALLKQLVAAMEPIPEDIKEAFERAKREVGGRPLRLPEIRTMLVRTLASLQRGFICIDALDEFPAKHRPELWDSLQYITGEYPNTRLFITGRPHIREDLEKHFAGSANIMHIEPTKEDISGYVTVRMEKDPELDAMDSRLKADILRIIPDRISGTFLLVSLIMDAILENSTIHRRRRTLHKMTNGFGLEDVYNTTLSRIREQKGDKVKLGIEALMWISRSERPLKGEELCHALAVEVGTTDLNTGNVPSIRTLLSCTLGLVKVDEQSSTIRLVHFTLQEYLAAHPNLFPTPHSMMAEVCLTYLNFQSVCELPTNLDTIPSTTAFLHYASCYWGFHARKEMAESVKHLALQLLERDANHISADILLREQSVGSLSWYKHLEGRRSDLRGFTGLHCIAYMGVTKIATAMLDRKRWDLNGRDSNGATPLIWAARCGNYTLAKLLLQQGDIDTTLSDGQGQTPLAHAAKTRHEGIVKLLLGRGDINPNSGDMDGRTPLSHAAQSGHEGIVKLLLERGDINPNSSSKYGWTPLSYAAGSGHKGVVRLLLERGDVNPDSSSTYGWTPLLYAAKSGHEGVVKLLLEREGVNLHSSINGGETPLSLAAKSGHEGVVKLLLDRGDINPDSADDFGRIPLSYAAKSGHEGVVKLLLDRGDINPDSADDFGRTPLSDAAESGHEGVVKLLLERGDVNPDSSSNYGWTPLSYAARSGHKGVVKLLLEQPGIDPDSSDKDGWTPLSFASASGYEGVVKLLLGRRDVNPDSSDKDGRTPLSFAAGSGREDVVKLLLARGDVNPDSSDKDRRTPLIFAAKSGYEGVVKLLLERRDLNPDSPDIDGRTPLSFAARSGREGVVKLLLERQDINPDLWTKDDRTPLSYAAESRHGGMVKLLLERGGVNPDSFDEDGRTPLSYASESGHVGVVKLLLKTGRVDPDSSTEHGQTPLLYAAGEGYPGVVKLLLEQGDVNPNLSNKDGWTPLSRAARLGYMGVVKLLLDREDVNPNPLDASGRTLLSYATEYGHASVIRLLSEAMPFDHVTSRDPSPTPQTSVLSTSAQEVQLGPASPENASIPSQHSRSRNPKPFFSPTSIGFHQIGSKYLPPHRFSHPPAHPTLSRTPPS